MLSLSVLWLIWFYLSVLMYMPSDLLKRPFWWKL